MLQKLKKKETKLGLSIDFSIKKVQHANLKFHDKTLCRILFC